MFTQDVHERYGASTLIILLVATLSIGPLCLLPMQGSLRLVTLVSSALFFLVMFAFTRPFRRVRIEVDDHALTVGFGSGFRETVSLQEIAACEPYLYRPLAEWGGWGYRLGPGGVMFNVFGDGGRAVRIRRLDGSAVHFSASDPEAVCQAIATARERRATDHR